MTETSAKLPEVARLRGRERFELRREEESVCRKKEELKRGEKRGKRGEADRVVLVRIQRQRK
jgi:hypothetical protein